MTRDKKRYIEALLYNYKVNKSRLEMLEKGLVSDDDFILGSIDYSKERVQSSNLSSLDNKIISREKEKYRLKEDIDRVKIMLNSLTEKEYLVVKSFYIEDIPNREIKDMIDRVDEKTVWRVKDKALKKMAKVI